jgi:hypothetical protein
MSPVGLGRVKTLQQEIRPKFAIASFFNSSTDAPGLASIVSSRLPWRFCGGLLWWQPSDLTRWRVSAVEQVNGSRRALNQLLFL